VQNKNLKSVIVALKSVIVALKSVIVALIETPHSSISSISEVGQPYGCP